MALLEVDDRSGIPIWVQLRNRFIYLIESGHYLAGDKLPTVRALAEELNINYHTVNKVYTSLEHEGYIKSMRGKGLRRGEGSRRGRRLLCRCHFSRMRAPVFGVGDDVGGRKKALWRDS